MRLLATAAVLLCAAVTACGDAEGTATPTTVSASTALPLVVERSGGVAGLHEGLLVRRNGTGTLTPTRGRPRRLSRADTARVRAALRELDFRGLKPRYGPPEGTVVADGIDYRFRAGGRTIVVLELAENVTAPLERLRAAAAAVMSG